MDILLDGLKPAERQYYLQHLIAPRPICFASTIDAEGNVNLSPFSFFNLFSATPPIVIFSAARRIRDNTIKHTLENVIAVPEVAISIVTADIVQQVSLASCEYPKETNEFIKAGFTPVDSVLIKPPGVKECKAGFECKVIDIKPLGKEGGAGNLIICEILLMHINDELLNAEGKLDQRKINHAARLGGDWYCSVAEDNLFTVPKPNTQLGIGFDALPADIKNSSILTGNDLGMLANVSEIPQANSAEIEKTIIKLLNNCQPNEQLLTLHNYAKQLLSENLINEAWQALRHKL